tara:strand:- start:42 stop:437 length:396 start_codon:yes stop_codon:yes gene_type:complete
MNNITLNASNEMDLKFADCLKRVKLGKDSYLKGTGGAGYFLVERHSSKYGYGYGLTSEITLDLDKVQPCIYTAMKHGLRVEVEYMCVDTRCYKKKIFDFSLSNSDRNFLMKVWNVNTIKSIKLLDMKVGEG